MCILIGNTIVNVAAATVAALFVSRQMPRGYTSQGTILLLQIVVVTLVILVFSEVSPKVFAVKQAFGFASRVSLPLKWFVRVLTPVSMIFEKMTGGVSFILGVHKEASFVDKDEFKALFEVGE